MRFDKVLPLLTDLHVVAPALAGYPFATRTASTGLAPPRPERSAHGSVGRRNGLPAARSAVALR